MIKDLGVAKNILGMEIRRNRCADKLYLSQIKYPKKVLKYFAMQDCKRGSTLFISHFRLSSALSPEIEEEKGHMLGVLYTSTVRSIIYDMVCIRPYISHDICVVNRFMETC